MTLTSFALRNAFLRNKTRSLLTTLGVVLSVVAFLFLRTVLTAWYAGSEASAADRVVTRNAISLTSLLPLSYAQRIAQVRGVTHVTYMNWFGGIYKDPKNFFAQFAIDPQSMIQVFPMRFLEGKAEDFLADRNSCIVGKNLASRFGWKLGDTIPLSSQIFPGDWRFKIAGIVEGIDDPSVNGVMYFQWARLNEALPDRIKNSIGFLEETIANPSESPRVIKDIDALFANSDNETHTETEKAFRLSFVTGSSAILTALETVSAVILVIMALILGNTLAMGLRERTPEMGAMRAVGFLPQHVRALALSEGAMLGLVGGLFGTVLAWPILFGFGKAMSQFGFLTNIHFKASTAVATVLASAAIGAAAAVMPAVQAARLSIVDALRRTE